MLITSNKSSPSTDPYQVLPDLLKLPGHFVGDEPPNSWDDSALSDVFEPS
jgi:hypothetical protein